MRRYDKLKNSEIEWFGKVPAHWNIKKVKYNFMFRTGFTPPTKKMNTMKMVFILG
jgi:hypothetical protein